MPRKIGSKDKQPRKRRGTALVAIKLSELNKTFNSEALILIGHDFAKSLMLKNYTAVDSQEYHSEDKDCDTPIQFTVTDPRDENGFPIRYDSVSTDLTPQQ
jgi:hypothetical protein